MNTILLTVDREHPDETVIRQAGEILKNGGLVAFPTETVYGLGGDGLNAESSEKIYAAKGGPLIIRLLSILRTWRALAGLSRRFRKRQRKWLKSSGPAR